MNYSENKFFISPKHKFTTLVQLIEFYKKNSAGKIRVIKTVEYLIDFFFKCFLKSLGLVCSLKYPLEKDELEINMNDHNSIYSNYKLNVL